MVLDLFRASANDRVAESSGAVEAMFLNAEKMTSKGKVSKRCDGSKHRLQVLQDFAMTSPNVHQPVLCGVIGSGQ